MLIFKWDNFAAVKILPILKQHFLPDLILFAFLIALSIFFYNKTISFWPSHIHAWTQGDRYALAIKFADTGLNLFKPRTFNLQTKGGITAVDLPVHDYAVGVIMNLTGSRSPLTFRLYTLIFSILGCWFLFRLARDAGGSAAKGLAVAVFVFTCPVITYYQTGFIPSATSFSAVLMGYYFYFRYQKGLELRNFYWAIGLLTLAALSRSPFNIFLFATLLQQALGWLQKRKVVRREALAYCIAYAVVIAANLYKIWLAQVYGSQFLGKLLPAPNLEVFGQILRSVLERWTFQVFSMGHYALLALAFFFLTLRLIQKKADILIRQIHLQSALAIAGGMIYFVLMARQFVDHEYYFMDCLYPGVALLLVAGMSCLPAGPVAARLLSGAFIVICLVAGAIASKKVQELKYADKPSEQAETTRKNFIGSERLLDSLGIAGNAKMLVIDAWSTNIPLILMNRMGYTLLSTRKEVLVSALNWDYDYVVVQDLYFPSDVVSNYPEILQRLERVGGNGRITVFRKSSAQRAPTLAEALGIERVWKTDSFDFQNNLTTSGWQYARFSADKFVSPAQAGLLRKEDEFGPTFAIVVGENKGRRDFSKVLFEGWYYAKNSDDKLHTVATLENNGQPGYYSGYSFRVDSTGQWRQFHSLFYLPDSV
ncbi:MAG TPA: glycosyltransferase family 39 protein, partial [Saprospiraceae bacterium]|nr:glycosyltransferase family 39 protein [Saprospiraceae bacterium]